LAAPHTVGRILPCRVNSENEAAGAHHSRLR
jgi:hypothetical protein